MERTPVDYLLRSARREIRWYHILQAIVGTEAEEESRDLVRNYPGVRKETEIINALNEYMMETADVNLGDLDAFREGFYRERPNLHSVNFWWRLIEISKAVRDMKEEYEEAPGHVMN